MSILVLFLCILIVNNLPTTETQQKGFSEKVLEKRLEKKIEWGFGKIRNEIKKSLSCGQWAVKVVRRQQSLSQTNLKDLTL